MSKDISRSPPKATVGSSTHTPQRRVLSGEGPSRRPTVLSPAYTSRKHSLYGIDDRVVIDPGSRVWKAGFSGEPDPRACFWAYDENYPGEAWGLDISYTPGCRGNRGEGRRLVRARVEKRLREVFHKHLLTDGKARKVIVVETTFLPQLVKEEIARALFDNLKAPSVAFTPSSLLALAACGRVTGLVVDCGWLETTVTPVYASRPLYHLAKSTPVAGKVLHTRLRALLRHFGQYHAPSLESAAAKYVPGAVLTDTLVERVLTESCFLNSTPLSVPEGMDVDSIRGGDVPAATTAPARAVPEVDDMDLMFALEERYSHSTAKDWTMSLPSPDGGRSAVLIVPGWIREYVAEVLFGDGTSEDYCVPEIVLQTLRGLPIDTRTELASSILITGGTASLPGFIRRLRGDILRLLPPIETEDLPGDVRAEAAEWRKRSRDKYAHLHGLRDKIAILNDPSPGPNKNSGSAPRWTPSLMSWVGGSLAGIIKTGAPEILREDYDQLCNDNMEKAIAFGAMVEESRKGAPDPKVGIELSELRPGMAHGPMEKRKFGWETEVLPDWTTVRVHAGA